MEARPTVYAVCDTLAHTLNTHKKIEDATWHFPDDLVHNLVDFILMPRCFKSNISKTKTWIYPGADIGSNHDLILTKFKKLKHPLHLLWCGKYARPKCCFNAKFEGKSVGLNMVDCDVDTLTGNIKEVQLSTAQKVLGQQMKKKQTLGHDLWD